MTHPHHPLPGSEREPLAGARRTGPADPGQHVEVTVVLRRSSDEPGAGAVSADIDRVEDFAMRNGLAVAGVQPAARSVRLAGTVEQMNSAFGVNLGTFEAHGLTYRGREGAVHVPADLSDAVVAVLGLDDRPAAEAHFRRAPMIVPHAGGQAMYPHEVAEAYGFPTDLDGTGQTVAVIELGGGFKAEDLASYFKSVGRKAPKVVAVSVDGAKNTPGGDADGEVMLDVEVIGDIAPAATIAVYFAPNTTNGFYDAVAAALHDTRRKPTVISISWGQAESGWTDQALDSYDALFGDAASMGVTVYAAAGDSGASDGAASGNHVDFPASSPHVVACGGTKLNGDNESVWNESSGGATGGGVSVHFGLPKYQTGIGVPISPAGKPGRGVPDVAGDADPYTGYRVRVGGQDQVIGGTSAVSPLWSALTLLINQRRGSGSGDVHNLLYGNPSAFRDITSGNNDGYTAHEGWDACTGLGTPRGDKVVAVLAAR